LGGSPSKDHDRNQMIASDLVSTRRRDCLHQTLIEAQPPQSGGADLGIKRMAGATAYARSR